jgi:hypothetical protein
MALERGGMTMNTETKPKPREPDGEIKFDSTGEARFSEERPQASMKPHEILASLRRVLAQPGADENEGKWNHGAHLFVALSTARDEAHDVNFREGSVPDEVAKALADRAADAEAFIRTWEFS